MSTVPMELNLLNSVERALLLSPPLLSFIRVLNGSLLGLRVGNYAFGCEREKMSSLFFWLVAFGVLVYFGMAV